MNHWGTTKTKFGAIQAIKSKGGIQHHDPAHDAQLIPEPEDPPPSASSHRDSQSHGLNASYYQQPIWSPSQPAATAPGQQYGNSTAASIPTQVYGQPHPPHSPPARYGYGQPSLTQSPSVRYDHGSPQQQSPPLQSHGLYSPGNVSAYQANQNYQNYQNNQFNTFASQPYSEPPTGAQYSPISETSMSPPQVPFAPLQRSTTDYYTYPQSPMPVQRSHTVPIQPVQHNCVDYWNEVLGRCLKCQPIQKRLFSGT